MPTPTPSVLTVAQDASFWSQLWSRLDTYLINLFGAHTGLLLWIVFFLVVVRPMITAGIKARWPSSSTRPGWAEVTLAMLGVLHLTFRWMWALTLGKLGIGPPPEGDEKTGSIVLTPPALATEKP